ncbi:hypothetical protein CBR_g28889 [Chara braunii]|uniref:2'-phosphotransferase n=1 Tax=Chara braunii TaxID=69332 RepID=A0A388LAF9_CHABU|nr:hypothetical protein CBR_g28889 [Chara braunii]|eukprot:GBG79173.1 hypothetical protein CBR_g28889 [Chara braunii]
MPSNVYGSAHILQKIVSQLGARCLFSPSLHRTSASSVPVASMSSSSGPRGQRGSSGGWGRGRGQRLAAYVNPSGGGRLSCATHSGGTPQIHRIQEQGACPGTEHPGQVSSFSTSSEEWPSLGGANLDARAPRRGVPIPLENESSQQRQRVKGVNQESGEAVPEHSSMSDKQPYARDSDSVVGQNAVEQVVCAEQVREDTVSGFSGGKEEPSSRKRFFNHEMSTGARGGERAGCEAGPDNVDPHRDGLCEEEGRENESADCAMEAASMGDEGSHENRESNASSRAGTARGDAREHTGDRWVSGGGRHALGRRGGGRGECYEVSGRSDDVGRGVGVGTRGYGGAYGRGASRRRGRWRGASSGHGEAVGAGHSDDAAPLRRSGEIDALGRCLTRILRHQAPSWRLDIRPDGYVPVEQLLTLKARTPAQKELCSHTVEDVRQTVTTDNKQRFGLLEENGNLLIRANQGHTMKCVQTEAVLTPIADAKDVPVCVHGTYYRHWEAIRRDGLSKMSRNEIHFAIGLPGKDGVISGMRQSCEVLIYVDVEKAIEDGIRFFRSDNNVVLTRGVDGVLPTKYFKRVVDRKTNRDISLPKPQ